MLYIGVLRDALETTYTSTSKYAVVQLANPFEAMELADRGLAYGGILNPSEWAAEAILLRVLRRVREGKVNPEQLRITVDGQVMGITDDGDFNCRFPGGFYEWRTNELF
jgi:hypothetical protein